MRQMPSIACEQGKAALTLIVRRDCGNCREMPSAYDSLPPTAFWRSGVVATDPTQPDGIYAPKFQLSPSATVATAGSCFAQHLGRVLKAAGVAVLDAEPAPPGLSGDLARTFGYGLFSARYGNIYTARQFRQLLQDACGDKVRDEDIWQADGRFYDALRPGIEPSGMDSPAEVHFLRRQHLARIRQMIADCDVFVFTAGLTETWVNDASGTVYPTAPGVIASPADGTKVSFLNLGYPDVVADLNAARNLLRSVRPDIRMLVTVSPVPLTATASGQHVLAATTLSKAILRAAAGEFSAGHDDVDYVPSFEIVTNPAARGAFFSPNLRSVTPAGVAAVMGQFLTAHALVQGFSGALSAPAATVDASSEDDVICEEALLDAFRK